MCPYTQKGRAETASVHLWRVYGDVQSSTWLGHPQVFNSDVGVHLKFEAKGDANAVDSPSELFITVRCLAPQKDNLWENLLEEHVLLQVQSMGATRTPLCRMSAVRRT